VYVCEQYGWGVLTVVQCNSGASAADTNTHAIVRARLIIVNGLRDWNAMPKFLVRKQRKHKRALEIKATEIMLVDLKRE
jgi:hypothetical protein